MIVDIATVRRLNQERRRETNRDKAEKFQAISEADRINSWNRFKQIHSGAGAISRGEVYYDCKANEDLIELFLDVEELPITLDTLEYAFKECRSRLAKFPTQPYERKTNVAQSRIAPQRRSSYVPPDKVAPYLRSELLAMTKTQLQNAVKIYGIRSINAILAKQN